jgi:hypothetical protein
MLEAIKREQLLSFISILENALVDYNDKLSCTLCEYQDFDELFTNLNILKFETQKCLTQLIQANLNKFSALGLKGVPSSSQAVSIVLELVSNCYKDDNGVISIVKNIQILKNNSISMIKEKAGSNYRVF